MTSLFVPKIAALGYRITISAYYGIQSATSEWQGHLMLPGGQDPYGSDIIAAHCERSGAEILITLMDSWVLDKGQIRDIRERLGIPVCCWMPVDTAELSEADENFLRATGAHPIAMSKHGRDALTRKGIPCSYVPHGCDTGIFKPPENRDELREQFNLKGRFSIIASGANKDQIRKSYGEVFESFRIFRERHPDANALLLVHALRSAPTGLNLLRMAERKGIADAVSFSDQYAYTIGQITQSNVADLFGAGDVLIQPSYGEGFGLPALEAQACGTPVIVNDCSAMTELCGSGWKTRGQKFWNEHHGEDWSVPLISDIVRSLEKAYEAYRRGTMTKKREQAREFALQYDADLITQQDWKPVLGKIAGMTRSAVQALDADRDAVTGRLSEAFTAGLLDRETLTGRMRQAVAATSEEDLASLVADLPEPGMAEVAA